MLIGFIFRIQNPAQFIELEIGYLVPAFPAQVDSSRARPGFRECSQLLPLLLFSRSFLSFVHDT
jgi:hypothetical protein